MEFAELLRADLYCADGNDRQLSIWEAMAEVCAKEETQAAEEGRMELVIERTETTAGSSLHSKSCGLPATLSFFDISYANRLATNILLLR